MKTDPYNFKQRLARLTNQELIEAFNKQVNVHGWANARGHYLLALQIEMKIRGFDITAVSSNGSESGSLSLLHHIKLVGNKLKPEVAEKTYQQ